MNPGRKPQAAREPSRPASVSRTIRQVRPGARLKRGGKSADGSRSPGTAATTAAGAARRVYRSHMRPSLQSARGGNRAAALLVLRREVGTGGTDDRVASRGSTP